jgi:hypothetical protein
MPSVKTLLAGAIQSLSEKLMGVAHFAVDPNDPLNAVIVDLDKAPRNSSGMVEFSTQVMIMKPVDMSLSNHKIFYRVNNRGNDGLVDGAANHCAVFVMRPAACSQDSKTSAGLLRRGDSL